MNCKQINAIKLLQSCQIKSEMFLESQQLYLQHHQGHMTRNNKTDISHTITITEDIILKTLS